MASKASLSIKWHVSVEWDDFVRLPKRKSYNLEDLD
ncbi:hypothetical protein T4E_12122 [Trichinella pseudospiralis]|uniref:Uncharacterized protein n=1 Tax=Trichinella pseudospiralis TaxID=6337 RepID=A0A0V0XUY8_TRIPS|nr:hypothetical protein T4E_12122 [Trichinella pseudospiralis]